MPHMLYPSFEISKSNLSNLGEKIQNGQTLGTLPHPSCCRRRW
jgi:hypothetical protein